MGGGCRIRHGLVSNRMGYRICRVSNRTGDSTPGSVHTVSLVGRWHLAYPEDAERQDAEGLTLLVFRRHGDTWRIVHDASM